jgi:hypothetical protein
MTAMFFSAMIMRMIMMSFTGFSPGLKVSKKIFVYRNSRWAFSSPYYFDAPSFKLLHRSFSKSTRDEDPHFLLDEKLRQ